jgi:hypothetical protein
MTNDIIVRRLSIIKYLYKQGVEQAKLPETISYSSILSIHDSIYMFMNLAAEKKGVNKGQALMQYFTDIPELTLKPSVDKINKRRNGLKHNGIIPGKVEIQDTCSVAKLFLEDNVNIIFSKDFNDISLFDLIDHQNVRRFLKEGNALLEKAEYKLAATEISKAYFHLLLIEDSFNKSSNNNPWYNSQSQPIIEDGKFYTQAFEIFFEGQEELFKEPKTKDGCVEITEGAAAIAVKNNKAFSYIFQAIRMLSLGLDYRKYNFFTSFMPRTFAYKTKEDKYEVGIPFNTKTEPDKHLIKENIEFALNFVLEFALKLQEFRY